MEYPLRLPAIQVQQPFGDFYIVTIKAFTLLEVTYKDPLRIREKDEETYSVTGKQREQKVKRLKEIGDYINSVDAAFPNSIILSVNYYEKGTSVNDENIRWKIIKSHNEYHELVIPGKSKIASIIDGQHRVDAFNYADPSTLNMDLLCAVYLDLPETYQAYLFATINYNQKPVPKSLAYELFGSSVEEEPVESWTPEKTAIYLTRKLNVNSDSPLSGHIVVSAQQDDLISEKSDDNKWLVSTATVVDGLMKLYSQNPRKDKVIMHGKSIEEGRTRKDLPDDNTPLRNLYISKNDLAIYKTVVNYFKTCEKELFDQATAGSYIFKTVGIQALFEILKEILRREFEQKKDISEEYFKSFLKNVKEIDFSQDFYQASGVGRSRIKNTISLANQFITLDDIRKSEDKVSYQRILGI